MLSTGKGHEDRMLPHGPRMSGLRIPRLAKFGPLDEKESTLGGEECCPITVPLKEIVAVGLEAELMYALILNPAE